MKNSFNPFFASWMSARHRLRHHPPRRLLRHRRPHPAKKKTSDQHPDFSIRVSTHDTNTYHYFFLFFIVVIGLFFFFLIVVVIIINIIIVAFWYKICYTKRLKVSQL
jgi:hypothetical protein